MATLSVLRKNDADNAGLARARATVYDSVGVLPLAGNVQGDQAFIPGDSSTDLMYIWDGGGWYKMALIQTVPSFTTGPDASYDLATDGATTTVITLVATDAEGIPVTFSATTDIGFDSIGTVSQDSSVFTVTPFSEDSAGTAQSGTITFKATDGISIASALSTFSLVFKVDNSNFTRVLIKAAGNNGTNVAINDASSNTHSISVNGNAVAQAFTPHHPGGYSAYFDGTNDAIRTTDDTSLSLGTSDFTVELWIKPDNTSTAYRALVSDNAYGQNSGSWCIYQYGTKLYIASNTGSGGQAISTLGGAGNQRIRAGEWQHIAFTRSSNTARLFHNGIQVGSDTTLSTNFTDDQILIGANNHAGGYPAYDYIGYISDVRVVKGTAVYTANFTPPNKKLTAIANTSLLTCHLPYFGDGSSNNHTVTFTGNTTLHRHSPYDYLSYKPSTHGASVYFDGSGDRLEVASIPDLSSGPYTIEGWYYFNSDPNSSTYLLWSLNTGSNTGYAQLQTVSGNNYLRLQQRGGQYLTNGTTFDMSANKWYHLATVWDGSNMRVFANGSVVLSSTTNVIQNAGNGLTINGDGDGSYEFAGYISDFRIVKGTAVYTSNFTPPTSPLTAVTNTELLTCNDTPNIYNASGSNDPLTLTGNAKSSTTYTKNANSSIYLDGNDDVRMTAYSLPIGTDDYTVEGWFYLTARNTSGAWLWQLQDGHAPSNPHGIQAYYRNSANSYNWAHLTNNTQYNTSTASILNQWQHVAIARGNAITTMFVDGVPISSQTGDVYNAASYDDITIGKGYSNRAMTGYVEDFRVTKGISRYPFIPAKETLTATADTVLLIGHDDALTNDGTAGGTATASGQAAVSDFGPVSGMKSIYFDGTGDYLTLGSNAAYAIGSSDNFSIECWVYFNNFPTGHSPILQWSTTSLGSSVASGTAFYGISSGTSGYGSISFQKHGVSDPFVTYANPNTHTIATRRWIHLHVQRSGTTAKTFVNGVLTQTTTSSSWTTTQNGLYIGARHTPNYFNGHISNLRFIKGSGAVIRSDNFTPPTSSLEA